MSCYERAFLAQARPSGRVEVAFQFGRDGSVSLASASVNTLRGTPGGAGLAAGLVRLVSSWRMPPQPAATFGSYPFDFTIR